MSITSTKTSLSPSPTPDEKKRKTRRKRRNRREENREKLEAFFPLDTSLKNNRSWKSIVQTTRVRRDTREGGKRRSRFVGWPRKREPNEKNQGGGAALSVQESLLLPFPSLVPPSSSSLSLSLSLIRPTTTPSRPHCTRPSANSARFFPPFFPLSPSSPPSRCSYYHPWAFLRPARSPRPNWISGRKEGRKFFCEILNICSTPFPSSF